MTSSTWACHVCTLENPARHKRCEACKARRAVVVDEFLQSPLSQSQSSSVRSWLSRRRKRKRPQQPTTVRVKIRLDDGHSPAVAGSFRDNGETVSEKRDSDETTQSRMTNSFSDACADRHWSATTDACGKGSVDDLCLEMKDTGRNDCHNDEIPKASPNISPTLEADCTFATMETTHCRKEPRSNDNDGMNQCAARSPGFEHDIAPNKHARAKNVQISNKPSSRDSSMVAPDPQHKDISSRKDISSFSACYDEDTVDTSSSSSHDGGTVEIGFSQLMSQQQSGFLYTQMTQSEAEFNSFPSSGIGKENGSYKCTKANATTDWYTRKEEELYGNPKNATEKVQSNDEPDLLTNEAIAPTEQLPNIPLRPTLDRIGNGSRIQVSKESLQRADELLGKDTRATCFAQCTFQTAGKGAVISVTEESLSRATALLQDAPAEVDSLPLQYFSAPSTSCQPEALLFHTAGEKSLISVSEDSMARATALLQNESVPAVDVDTKESSQATSSLSADAPQFASAFRAAGQKVIVSVMEDSRTWANPLLQDATAADEPKIYSIPVASGRQSVARFQTAGTGSLISIKEESMERAMALFKDTMAAKNENEPFSSLQYLSSAPRPSSQQGAMFQCTEERNMISVSEDSMALVTGLLQKASPTYSLSRDLSSSPTTLPRPRSMFQIAGQATVISVSDVSMERATARLQNSSVTLDKAHTNDLSQQVSSASTNVPPFASMSHSAGKKNVVSVTVDSIMRAKASLQNERATDVEPVPKMGLSPVANGPVAMFQTAGKGSAISLQEESKARATVLLDDKSVATTSEVDPYLLSRELSSTPTALSQSRSMFQTAGKGTVISVSDDSMKRATALLQDSSVVIAEAGTKKSSAALSIFASTSAPQFTATFHTAGKNAVVSVTDDGLVHASALLQEKMATDVEQASHIHLSSVANGSQAATKFQTAGKGSLISVKEESMAFATLLQGKSACSAQAHPKKPPQELSPSSQSCSLQALVFQAAGKGNISEDRLEPVKVVLQNTSPADDSSNMIESSQDVSSATAGMSRRVALFQTTGDETVVSVMTANILLHDAATADIDDLAQPSGVDDTMDSGFELDLKEPPQELSSVETMHARSAGVLQTDGQGSVVSVLEESLTRASKGLHDSLIAKKDETPTPPYQGSDMKWSSSASPMEKSPIIDAIDECRAKAADDPTKECNTRFAKASCNYIDTDESTQPVPPETPLLLYRNKQLESLQHKETSMAILSAAFRLTPQSQHDRGNLVPRRHQAFDTSPETCFESPDDVHPEPHTNLANQSTPASRLLVSEITKRGASLYQSTLANPAFTPKQTPASITSAAVTMSVDPKNPYLRNPHNNPNRCLSLKDAYSPVPIDFRHSDGTFRGKVISPSSISYAELVLSRGPGESRNELNKLPVSAHYGGSTLLDSRTKKKVVTWSEDTVKSDRVPTRTTLLNFAAEYGKMNDCISVGLNAGVHPVTLAVDSNNAARIRFDAESELPCSFFGQACPPNCKIVGSVKDLRASLLSRGCEEKKLVDKWISSHYRWIVWKLASMERRFASSLAQSYLTYDHVITQLKKRYERELKGGERSALRKVLNRDVAANSMMILCVCQPLRPIKGEGTDTKNSKHDVCYVELTDGWYSIRGVLDASLSAHVRNRKVKEGTKLLICNGRLEGSEDGVDPLDPSYSCSGQNCSVALYLSANGTRLANWDAKMGFVKPSQYMRSTRGSLLVRSISHIIPGGGNVPLIDVIVCRLYPRMFLERKGMSYPSDSFAGHSRKSPVISEAQECRNRMDFEKKRQQGIERLSETVENECAKEVDEMAPELWKSLMKNGSPCDFYEQLSRCDQVVVDRWKEKRDTLLQDMAQKVMEERLDGDTAMFRESTPFIRVFVKSFNPFNKKKETEEPVCEGAMLTIWNPSEQQLGLLREGHVVRLRNLLVRATKHEGLVQLTAGAKTQMETILSSPLLPSQLASLGYSSRVFAKLFRVHTIAKKLSANLLPSSPAPEVDTAAILLRVLQEGNTEERELIYITDETGLVLRVERDRISGQEDSFISRSKSAWQNAENPTTVAFRDLRITHFDSAENCAVAVYTQTSCVASKSPRFSELLKWTKSPFGHCLLRRLAACMDSGIPLNQPASTQTAIATGYIAGFNIPETSNNSHLEIKVDCGMAELLVWDFPFFLLDDALSLCNIAPEPVSLEREVDEMYAKLKVLGKIFGARGLLLVFSLRHKSNMAFEDGRYEVRKVKVAESNALAHVYVNTVKEAEQERKGRLEKQKK